MRWNWVVASLLVAVLPAGCVVEYAGEPDELTWEEFQAAIYREPDTGIYIVNGDEPISSEPGLRAFYERMMEDQQGDGATRTADQPLIVYSVNGSDVAWNTATAQNLTYCVSTTFGTKYTTMVGAMNEAAASWEAAAPGVNFVHVSSLDSKCNAKTTGVVFDVRPTSTTAYAARAFFPNDTRAYRNILFSTYYLQPGTLGVVTIPGVLRHEMGHILGFRHEHTRPEAAACFEDNSWRELTPYDANSVMHYPQCNGTNVGDLVITESDAAGSRSLYPGGGDPPPPPPECGAVGATCSAAADCCSNSCNTRRNICR